MDSSDESFLWTKASTGSDDDDSDEMNLTTNNDDGEGDIKIKKENQNEQDTNSHSDKGAKKRKHKRESVDLDEADSPKKKRIKTEPQSDCEHVSKKKKKKDKGIANGTLHDSDTIEDDYLNTRVKEEMEYKESSNINGGRSDKQSKKSKKLSDSMDINEIHPQINGGDQLTDKKSKKKKKHCKDNSEHEETSFFNGLKYENDDNSLSEISQNSPKKKKSKKDKYDNQVEINNLSVEEEPKKYELDTIEKNSKQWLMEKTNEDLSNAREDCINKVTTSRKPRLSDRIKFEDEIELESNTDLTMESHNNKETSHLKTFITENNNLIHHPKISNKCLEINDDDEIWILKCPHDIDTSQINNIDIDNRSKIKINGETYYGYQHDNTKINILSSSNYEYKIKNFMSNGIIHFRKRLPKPHYHEENVMVNNQTDFIPLPETKCRHPLFGSNYKDAINVCITRPNQSVDYTDAAFSPEKKKKKKHKKKHDTEQEHKIRPKIEYDSDESGKKEHVDFEAPVKKAKKRKHSANNGEHSKKKSKRIKLEPDSAEAWESEKAIEENLFNF